MKLYELVLSAYDSYFIFAMSFADAEETFRKLKPETRISSINEFNKGTDCYISKQAFDDYSFSEKLEKVQE